MRAKGTLLGRIVTDHLIHSLVNDQTDRVYLISDNGLVECLRETDAERTAVPQPEGGRIEEGRDGVEAGRHSAKTQAAQHRGRGDYNASKPPAEKKPVRNPNKPAGDFGVKDNDNPFGN